MSGIGCITREVRDVPVVVDLRDVEATTDVDVEVRVDYGRIITEFESLVAMGYARDTALDILAKDGVGVEIE